MYSMKSPPTRGESFIIYKRVATTLDQHRSLAVQDTMARRFVSEADGYVVLVLEDIGSGARDVNRAGYQTLLKCIRKRRAQNVVVSDLSRLSRDLQHLMYLYNLARENNVALWDVRFGRITEMEMMALGMVSHMQPGAFDFQGKEALPARGLRAGRRMYGYDIIEKTHEPFIKMEQYKKVQSIFSSRPRATTRTKEIDTAFLLLHRALDRLRMLMDRS